MSYFKMTISNIIQINLIIINISYITNFNKIYNEKNKNISKQAH